MLKLREAMRSKGRRDFLVYWSSLGFNPYQVREVLYAKR